MVVGGGLPNSCEKKGSKGKGEKERHPHLNVEFQRKARRDKKVFRSDQNYPKEKEMQEGKVVV